MSDHAIVPVGRQAISVTEAVVVPATIEAAGRQAKKRFVEFFTASIRNPNTLAAYARAVVRFCDWCEARRVTLAAIEPTIVAAYIEDLLQSHSEASVKQHLAAIRMVCDYLVTGGVLAVNPAASVRGPRLVILKGKTPVLSAEDARQLLDAIDITKIAGLRDRALIGLLVFSFARIGAALKMDVSDYYQNGKRFWVRLHEKGGRYHEMPMHHSAEQYLDEYLLAGNLYGQKGMPFFRTLDRTRNLTEERMTRNDALRMIKRRARAAELPDSTCCHTFRATGITAYLRNNGTLEKAQKMAAHRSATTTSLYDRTADEVTLDEVERIMI